MAMAYDGFHDFTNADLRSEVAFIQRRVRALEQAERALRKAADALHANGDRDLADMLFASWCDGDRDLDEARETLSKITRAEASRLHGTETRRSGGWRKRG